MNVGISSAVFYPMETELAIEKIISLGFHTVEVFINCETELSENYLKTLSERLSEAGVRVVSVHPYTSLAEGIYFFSDYARRTEESIKKYCEYFRAAKLLGASYFTFHGDRNISGLRYDDDTCLPLERDIRTLKRLSDAAKQYGVTVCMENVSWCKSANYGYLRAIAEQLGDDIGFTLDYKQARRLGLGVDGYMDIMKDNLKNVHISDYDSTHSCLLPGFGRLNIASELQKLRANNYSEAVIIEIYSTNFDAQYQIRQSCEMLQGYISAIYT